MKHTDIRSLITTLYDTSVRRLKTEGKRYGSVNPVGDGDAKTGAPSTYRPVLHTCPTGRALHLPRCPYLGVGCYAECGNVNIHQGRASIDVDASVISAAIGIVWAIRDEKVCRLHVSGDFVLHDCIGHRYIAQLGMVCDIARDVGTNLGFDIPHYLAWSYTHIPKVVFEPYRTYLDRKGVHVRYSDVVGENGAIVYDFAHIDTLRKETGGQFVRCPAQLSHQITCVDCRVCWLRPSHTVVFHPHGTAKRKIADKSHTVLHG